MSGRIIYRIIWMSSLIVLIGMFAVWSKRTTAIAEPEAMTAFVTGNKAITLDHPKNWEAKESDIHGVSTIISVKADRNAGMKISYDEGQAAMVDIMNSTSSLPTDVGLPGMDQPGAANQPAPKKKSALEKMHELNGKSLASDYEEQEYQEGATTQLTISGQPGLATEFSYKMKAGWGGSGLVEGRRYTVVTPERVLTVVQYCPKEMKEICVPVFDKMIASLRLAPVGGQQ